MGDTTDELLDQASQITDDPPGRELDMLLTAGERISMALLAIAISTHGYEARSFTGSQAGVITTGSHGRARIIDVTPGRLRSALDEGSIVIVAGFQGVSQDTKDITTLGRGGSDTTAVAVAAALDADVCEIYTDVDGVFTADPRIVPNAKRLDTITYEEMLELAASGAKVLMLRCVEYARRYGGRAARGGGRSGPPPLRHPRARPQLLLTAPRHDRGRLDGGPPGGTGDHHGRRARPLRGQDHRLRGARPAGRGGAAVPGAG